jgi:hypothetical protein
MSDEASSPRMNHLAGRCLSVLGMIGLLLIFAARTSSLPARLDALITGNSAAWLLASVGLFLLGVRMLWRASHGQITWRPARAGKRFRSVIVYSRPGCLLCDDAMEVLSRYRRWLPPAQEVNIENDPALRSKFEISIPVVEIDRRVRFRGQVSEVLLQRLIEGTPPLASRLR